MQSSFVVKTFMHATGEKSPMLFCRASGLPEIEANDWKLERRSKTHSHQTLRQELMDVAFLYDLAFLRGWPLERLFDEGNGLTSSMLATVCDLSWRWHPDLDVDLGEPRLVGSRAHKSRVEAIRHYSIWRLERVRQRVVGTDASANAKRANVIYNIERHRKGLEASAVDSPRRRGLTASQVSKLHQFTDPRSDFNPFQKRFRLRNFLIVQLLLSHGLRRSEVLLLFTTDIDYRARHPQISVYRRPDSPIEPRKDVAVKTRERVIAMDRALASLIRKYVKGYRASMPRAIRSPFLFLNKDGEPLGTDGFDDIFGALSRLDPDLSLITGHQLRNTWADAVQERISLQVKLGKITQNLAVLAFNYLGGWTQQSVQSTEYSRGFIEATANELYSEISAENEALLKSLNDNSEEL